MNPSETSVNPTFGVNLFGYLTSNLGLGVAARNTALMLLANEVPCRFIDVNPGGGMQGKDKTFADKINDDLGGESYSINMFHINPDQVQYLLSPLKNAVTLPGRVNACVPFWELPRLPDSWMEPLSAMDAVFAPTHFVETAVRDRLPDLNVIHYPQAVHVPADILPDRDAFGLPHNVLAFVMSFDMRSDIERKNPVAAIEAFLQAFPERKDVRLLIKANNVETIAGLERNVARLREISHDPRILVLDRPMGYREVLSMYASSDVLVSLHRAEGLGLSLLEAMALGKPVIATGWSGNMDFMTAENSCSVGFEMIDVVSSTQPAYGKGMSGSQQWANPSVVEAATWMRRLADDEALRRAIGARAKADVSALTSSYDSGGTMLPALKTLKADAAAAEKMARLQRHYPVNQGKRLVRAAVNRLRTRIGLS